MNKSFAHIIAISTLLIFFSCGEKKETLYIYKKPIEKQLDAVANWLRNESNFSETNYENTFNKYYDDKIKAKNFQLAMISLKNVATNAMRFQSYSTSFREKIDFFSKNYRNQIPDKQSLAFLNIYLGKYYADKSEFEKAIQYYTKGTTHEVIDYETCYSKAVNFRNIAWCYFCLGKQDLAIKNNLKALELLKKTDRKDLLGGVYFNLYPIYLATKDYKNAELNLNKAAAYYKLDKEKHLTNIYVCLYNKIQLYDDIKKVEKKRILIDSTLLAFEKSGLDDPSMKISLYLLDFKMKLEDLKVREAEQILNKIKPEIIALNSEYTTSDYNTALALLEIKNTGLKNTKLIIDAIPALKESRDFQNVRNAYSILHIDAVQKKQFEKALNFYYQFQQASDSLGDERMLNKVVELEKKYQTEKKEQQIALQKTTILNKNTTIAFLATLFAALFLVVVVYINKQKQKKLLAEKQNAQQYTKQLLEKTEEERKRIASDLHDSVSHELLSLKNTFEEKTDVTNSKIDAIINDIRIISRNLHPIMFDKIGLKESIIQLVERTQLTNNFMVTAEIDYSSDLLSSTELQIYRIVQESLSNIIKYAQAIAAKITIQENEKYILIEIKDNGKGFNVTETLNGKRAFGLHNIIERSRAIGGETKILSSEKGTIINIEIKK